MPDDFIIPLGQVPITVGGQMLTVDGQPITLQGPLTGLASECHAAVKHWRLDASKVAMSAVSKTWRLEVVERC